VEHTKRVIIIGAGDHGRGTLEILRACNDRSTEFEIVGFLDDDASKLGREVGGAKVLGGLAWLAANHHAELWYILALAACRLKERVDLQLAPMGLRYINAIHPAAHVHSSVHLNCSAIINAGAVVAYDTVVHRHVTINLNATVGHDCSIGRYCTIAPGANIAGKVIVNEGSDIGLNATVGKGLTLGAWASVGPGSVVIKDRPSGSRCFGNPAREVPTGRSPIMERSFQSRRL
jgi:sugar O-acyltransferase (sialic acid O-acetyltransferase NeuD family)